MKKLEAKDAELQEKSAQIEASQAELDQLKQANQAEIEQLKEANQAELEELKQKLAESAASAGDDSDKDAKIAELETAINAKNEELEANNQERTSLQAASQGLLLTFTPLSRCHDKGESLIYKLDTVRYPLFSLSFFP